MLVHEACVCVTECHVRVAYQPVICIPELLMVLWISRLRLELSCDFMFGRGLLYPLLTSVMKVGVQGSSTGVTLPSALLRLNNSAQQ